MVVDGLIGVTLAQQRNNPLIFKEGRSLPSFINHDATGGGRTRQRQKMTPMGDEREREFQTSEEEIGNPRRTNVFMLAVDSELDGRLAFS